MTIAEQFEIFLAGFKVPSITYALAHFREPPLTRLYLPDINKMKQQVKITFFDNSEWFGVEDILTK
jgi:hypothetical protein